MNKIKTSFGLGVTLVVAAVALYFVGQPDSASTSRSDDQVELVAMVAWTPEIASPSASWSVWINQVLVHEKDMMRKAPEPYTFTAPRGSLVQIIAVSPKARQLTCFLMAARGRVQLKRHDTFDLPEVICQYVVA